MRRPVLVIAVAIGGMLMAGCLLPVPANILPINTIVAVYLDGGRPTIDIRPCGHTTVTTIKVSDAGPSPEPTIFARPSMGAGRSWSVHGADGVDHAVLLETPPGWTVTKDTLTEFVDGTAYDIDFAASEKAAFAEFTLDDLRATPAGDVWMDGRPVSRDEFNQTAGCIH